MSFPPSSNLDERGKKVRFNFLAQTTITSIFNHLIQILFLIEQAYFLPTPVFLWISLNISVRY
ncbi:MAG: hypothetical protein US15_C0071G0007 [Candidatus Moranbacteria bacterium GW2011_GWF1_36_4]|nr:MAG: hypothetical protein US15_C0071G0007 [Candidatus Moranbacteria bacterium GW2011_GWF1_36_4]